MIRLLALLVLTMLSLPLSVLGQPSRPDIVLIVTDDMRSSDWEVLGQTKGLRNWTVLPHMVYPTPLCCPTRTTLNLGQYAHNTGVHINDATPFLARQDETLATALHDVGYYSINGGKFIGGITDTVPGWDDWADSGFASVTHPTDRVRARVVAAIEAAPANQPWLLWVGFRDPHTPYDPAAQYAVASVGTTRNADDAERRRELLSTDDAIAAIAEAMGPRWDSACVVVMSDNGFLLGEHGATGKSIWWEDATEVKARIACDGIAPGNDPRLAATIDIVPTLLRAGGAAVSYPLDGRALQDAWDRDGVLLESWALGSSGEARVPFTGIRGKSWVYVEAEGMAPQFYVDPAEAHDIYATLPAREQAFYADWLASLRTCAGNCRDTD